MLSIIDQPRRLCDGIARRELLRAGSLASLSAWTGSRGRVWGSPAAPASGLGSGPAKRCIVLFLMGGPSQHSTWDPKPFAPLEIRGEFSPIATAVPGVQISELFPRIAMVAQHLSFVRSVSTADNAHSSSGYAMMTGQPHFPPQAENVNPGPPNDWPTMGAIVQHFHQGKRLFPPAVRLPHQVFNTDHSVWPGQDSGFLGYAADPWLFNCEPASPKFEVPNLRLQSDVTLGRLGSRRSLLSQLEDQLRGSQTSGVVAHNSYLAQREQALTLLEAPTARDACDLSLESAVTRDRYGRGQFGQSVLLGRRLLEAGVTYVHVNWFRGADEPSDAPCWDSHTQEAQRMRTVLAPGLDSALSALLTDLDERGMLEETLVAVLSEFGRTPRFNGRGGRDHWGHVFSIALAGGGVRGGQTYGASDAQGAFVAEDRVTPADLTATIFHQLGLSPHQEILNALGRPIQISRGEPIRGLL